MKKIENSLQVQASQGWNSVDSAAVFVSIFVALEMLSLQELSSTIFCHGETARRTV
jgi:hypothetical protein